MVRSTMWVATATTGVAQLVGLTLLTETSTQVALTTTATTVLTA